MCIYFTFYCILCALCMYFCTRSASYYTYAWNTVVKTVIVILVLFVGSYITVVCCLVCPYAHSMAAV